MGVGGLEEPGLTFIRVVVGVSEANGHTGVWGPAPVLPSAVRPTLSSLLK